MYYSNILTLFVNAAMVTAFVPAGTQRVYVKTSMSSNDYLGRLTPPNSSANSNDRSNNAEKSFFANLATQRLNNGRPSQLQTQPEQRNGNQPTGNPRVDDMERTLQQRLNKLEQTEKLLEQRMANVALTERALQQQQPRQGPAISRGSLSDPRRAPMSTFTPAVKGRDNYDDMMTIDKIWEMSTPVVVQGSSLRTWSFANPAVKRVHVLLKTDGRPLDADIQLWQGPDNTPNKMKVYVEDGAKRTFSAFIDTPDGPNAVCVKNIGPLEFPLYACVGPDVETSANCLEAIRSVRGEIIQGGALRTYPFGVQVDSIAVMITTNGRPLNARLELLQGPNNNKQVLELYTEDGLVRPLLCVVQTPGSGNVLRLVNKAPVEFPMHASVVEYEYSDMDPYAQDGVQIENQW